MPAKRILLVDDNAQFLGTLSEHFAKSDYEIECCSSTVAAIEKFEENSYDTVITDYVMPSMSGVDLLKKFHETNKKCQLILMTGVDPREVGKVPVPANVDILLKPFSLEKLEALLG